jgi:hypothetical protein
MAAANLNLLLDKVRHLSPDKLAQVEAFVEKLESGQTAPRGRFRALSGLVSAEDAGLMASAVEDCERIDPHGW